MNINEMLKELKENSLTELSVGIDTWSECYRGLRVNTCEITNNTEYFIMNKNSLLEIIEDGVNNESNIKFAYKQMLIQKFSLPNII